MPAPTPTAKSEKRTALIEGRARKSYGHRKPFDQWEVFIKDHHEGYIEWASSSAIRSCSRPTPTARPAARSPDAAAARCWLGFYRCGRCGRRLVVLLGPSAGQPVYRCELPNQMLGRPRCFIFGGQRVDAAIARELLRAVEPMAIEAALEAERRYMEGEANNDASWNWSCSRRNMRPRLPNGATLPAIPIIGLSPRSLRRAGRRRCACPGLRGAIGGGATPGPAAASPDFAGLADDLEAAWNAPGVTMRSRQRLLRALDHRHHRRCRRGGARDRPDDPLARRPAFGSASPQAEIRRAWLPHPRRGSRRDAQHGDTMVGRGHRRIAEPDGIAYRPG